jgi:CelD/BcsL family acetyltransferase involved in cellulose biosynthesis
LGDVNPFTYSDKHVFPFTVYHRLAVSWDTPCVASGPAPMPAPSPFDRKRTLRDDFHQYTGLLATRRFRSGQLEVEILDSIESLKHLESEWHHVWQCDPEATPFQNPAWLVPWTSHLWGGGKLRILALRKATRLAAVAPFFIWGFGARSEVLRLSFLGSGVSDYLGMTSVPEYRAEASEAVIRWVADPGAEWAEADLQELRPGSALLQAASLVRAEVRECSVCPVLKLRTTFADQLAEVRPAFRRSLRTADKRLHAAGKVEFVRGDTHNHKDLLNRLFDLHAKRWEERDQSGMFSTESLCAFHRELTDGTCLNGMLRMYGLTLNGQYLAVQYNLAAKGRTYAYQAGFDPAHGKASPGAVLLAYSIREAIAEGAREFDFLRHPAEFKHAWGALGTPNKGLLIPISPQLSGQPREKSAIGSLRDTREEAGVSDRTARRL